MQFVRQSSRRLAPFALLVSVVVVVPSAAAAVTTTPASVCDRFRAEPDQTPVLGDPVLTEVSGLAASHVQPPLLWVHNDSGGQPAVYAIRPDGSLAATYLLAGTTNTDWEDIAVGPGPARGVSYLYVGDIGDNLSTRDHVTVYRVAEPKAPFAATGTLTDAATITLRYADHPVDAESMFVDPRRGDLFLIDKEYFSRVGRVFRAPKRALVDGADITLEEVASFTLTPDASPLPTGVAKFPGTIVTGADVSPDGSTVLVRTYRRVLAFSRPRGKPLAAAFSRPACEAPQIDERQGEAVGFAANGASYFTISEGAGASVHGFAVRPPLAR